MINAPQPARTSLLRQARGAFEADGQSVRRIMEQIVRLAARMAQPTPLYIGVGAFSDAAPLLPALNRYPDAVALYGRDDIALVAADHIIARPLDGDAPFGEEWFILVGGVNWQIGFAAAPTNAPDHFRCIITRDLTTLGAWSDLLDAPPLPRALNTQHDLTATLLWEVANAFSEITGVVRGVGDLAMALGFAWLLNHRRQDRWQIAAQAMSSLAGTPQTALYRLNVAEQELTRLPAADSPPIPLYEDTPITRAVFANQIINVSVDGETIAALPMLQGETIWGAVEVRRAKPFTDAEIESLSVFTELIKLALIAYDMPAIAPARSTSLTPQLDARTDDLMRYTAEPPSSSAPPEMPRQAPVAIDDWLTMDMDALSADPAPRAINDETTFVTSNLITDEVYWPELDDFERAVETIDQLLPREIARTEILPERPTIDLDSRRADVLGAFEPLPESDVIPPVPIPPPSFDFGALSADIFSAYGALPDLSLIDTPAANRMAEVSIPNPLPDARAAELESELEQERILRAEAVRAAMDAERQLAALDEQRRDLAAALENERAARVEIERQIESERRARVYAERHISSERETRRTLYGTMYSDLRLYITRVREQAQRAKTGATLNVAQAQWLDQIINETNAVGVILNEIEPVARAERSPTGVVDLIGLLRDVQTTVHPQSTARAVTVLLSAPDDDATRIHVEGEWESLARALYNLLVSAVYLAQPQTTITLDLLTDATHAALRLAITLKREYIGRVEPFFQHFEKGVPHRSGLALARTIFIAHQGQIEARDLPDGRGGFEIVVRLPLAEV
jgi:signal transduction histidine kinase